jgi:hypothetical protein
MIIIVNAILIIIDNKHFCLSRNKCPFYIYVLLFIDNNTRPPFFFQKFSPSFFLLFFFYFYIP